jgi:putative ABC transport system ATP-binding protein
MSYGYPTSGGPIEILREIDLSIECGSSWGLLGISGAGKTTLLALLAGLELPQAGSIRLLGHDLATLTDDGRADLRLQSVGFVFQTFHLLASLTAFENVVFPLRLRRLPDAVERARSALTAVGLEHRFHHRPAALSGGEQQRVALARAFAGSPQVLFADEPTGNLDAGNAERIADLLFTLNAEQGSTLVLATHDRRLVERCRSCAVLDGGGLRAEAVAA